jgi:hypothetical protein
LHQREKTDDALAKQARHEEAEKLFLEAIDVSYVKLDNTHPHKLKIINNLIALYEAWNNLEKAKE